MQTKWILIQSIQSIDWRTQTYPTPLYFALERKKKIEEDERIKKMILRTQKRVFKKYEKIEKKWVSYWFLWDLKFIAYNDPNYSQFDDEMSNIGCDMARESL